MEWLEGNMDKLGKWNKTIYKYNRKTIEDLIGKLIYLLTIKVMTVIVKVFVSKYFNKWLLL